MSEMFVQKKTWLTHTHNLENSGEIPMYQITCDYGITPIITNLHVTYILNQYAHGKLFETINASNF